MARYEAHETAADFNVDRETLAFIVLKARAFDALVASDDPTDAADDRFVDALEDEADNPTEEELRAAIAGLDVDAKASLVALTWLGRGDYDADEWEDALEAARQRGPSATTHYLMGVPLLGDFLEDGAAQLGIALGAEETEALSDPQAVPPRPH